MVRGASVVVVATLAVGVWAAGARGQLTAEDIESLRQRGQVEGWTFTVGESEATHRSIHELCGLQEPANWRGDGRWDPCTPVRSSYPDAFDWRDYGAVPPVRNQGGCGSCWAFAAMGATESAIAIHDGLIVDLSEQWLISCTGAGNCGGGWHYAAFRYIECDHLGGSCDGRGAVFETGFPYVAWNAPCRCPYHHPYCLQSSAFIGDPDSIPSKDQIRQAITNHGPVAVCVHVNDAFHAYSGGVFNACEGGDINHAVVIVGWEEAGNIWIVRNSWGESWGEDGYMRIEDRCSRIGYAACYVDYAPVQDCNDNGVADYIDVADGESRDCNDNGVPDECEEHTRTGLAAAYYDTLDLAGPPRGHLDATVEFPWGSAGPVGGFEPDSFSARWTGFVHTPAAAGEYTFYTRTDDGVRLWIADQLIVDKWIDQAPAEWSGTITLEADTEYPVRMEYYENGGGAVAELWWQPPGQAKVIIPAGQLIPGRDCNDNDRPDACDLTDGTSGDCNANGIPDECESPDCNGNRRPDECDLADGRSPDGNGNRVPDECEAETLYVDAAATGAGTGLSWADAYTNLTPALGVAANPDNPLAEIQVAEGVYHPDQGSGDRSAAFTLSGETVLQGGFASGGGQHDPATRPTILSGDIGVSEDPADNCYHVITVNGAASDIVLDGFTIAFALADASTPHDRGAGIHHTAGRLTLLNCRFVGNQARVGAGVFSADAALVAANCAFSGNIADAWAGGAMHLDNAQATLTNCTFVGNQAALSHGAALRVVAGGDVVLCNDILWANRADGAGGEAAQISVGPEATLTAFYCCIEGWSGTLDGLACAGGDPLLRDPDGPDDRLGTIDDDPRLDAGSPCIDAGDNPAAAMLGITTDLFGAPRFVDDVGTPDTGYGGSPVIDMGVHEYFAPADFDADADVDLTDFQAFQSCFGLPGLTDCTPGDLDQDGMVNASDVAPFVARIEGPS